MSEDATHSFGDAAKKTVRAAETTIHRPVVRNFARLGFYTKGVLFVVIGALAIILTAGLPEGRIADPASALAMIAQRSFGKVLLVIFVAGAVGHGFWNLLRAVADIDDAGRNWFGILKRSIAAGIGLFYLGLALTAFEIVLAARVIETPSQAEETFVSVLLAIPLLGTLLLFVVGIGVIGAGFYECYNGLSGRFRDTYRVWEITWPHEILIPVLGVLSFSSRAVILVIVGYYFVAAAIWDGPNGSIGLDAALLALAQTGHGRVFLFAAAVGLFAHGVLAFYEAKYRRID